MSVKWLHLNADGYSWTALTYVEEVAPSMEIGAPQHAKQTWFIVNLQPDGICMNCRVRPGLEDPIGHYYSCEPCRASTDAVMRTLLQRQAA